MATEGVEVPPIARSRVRRASRAILVRYVARLGLTAAATLAVAFVAVAVYVADGVTRVDRDPVDISPRTVQDTYEDVTLRTADGLVLRGWLFPATKRATDDLSRVIGPTADRAVVLVHGKDGNRMDSPYLQRVARWLLGAGYTVLTIDMRGHGASEGQRFSLGQHERLDVAAAIDHLVARGIRIERIALLGESMGAGTVLQAVALRPDVGAVVADSAYADGRTIVDDLGPQETGLPHWFTPAIILAARLLFDLDVDRVDPKAVVASHPRTPFLLIHCENDGTVNVKHARRLVAAAGSASESWIAEGCGHVGASDKYFAEYDYRLALFLSTHIR